MGEKTKKGISASFVTGAIALVFLIVGFQAALFVNKAAVSKVLAERGETEVTTVDVASGMGSGSGRAAGAAESSDGAGLAGTNVIGNEAASCSGSGSDGAGTNGGGANGDASGAAGTSARGSGSGVGAKRTVTTEPGFSRKYSDAGRSAPENFRFDPNTATVEELQRLGFSEKQARAIENYRLKGGRFRRKSDFSKSFVVSEEIFSRLEPYIDIPLTELNSADSAAFDDLPGIGGYFASQMVKYRKQLGGYSYKEQLMDIYRFDADKFAALEDLVIVDTTLAIPYPLWTLPEDSLALHPYIGKYSAHGIVVFRENTPAESCTIEALDKAGILQAGMAEKLSRCRILPRSGQNQ